VETDEQGERFKDWRRVVGESYDCSGFGDWPLEADAVALDMCKHFSKHGGNPLAWLDRWLSSKGVEAHERTAHEMSTLLRAVWYFGVYDQYNVGASAGMETLLRRVAQITEAYRHDATRPSWTAVRHFGGSVDAMDPVPLSLRAFNAKRAKEEADVENHRFRGKGLAAPAGGLGGSLADDGGLANDRSAAKARAKGSPKKGAKGGPAANAG
jgi:hypothetical protein